MPPAHFHAVVIRKRWPSHSARKTGTDPFVLEDLVMVNR